MNKIKKVLGCFVLGAAATVMAATGGLFMQQQMQTYSASVTEEEINNSLPAFVEQEELANNYFFSTAVPMKFDVATVLADVDEVTPANSTYFFKYIPDETNQNNYYYFDISSVAIYINDTRLNVDTTDLILQSTSSVQINQQGDSQTGQNEIRPEIVYFEVRYDAAASTPQTTPGSVSYDGTSFTFEPAILTTNQTGVLRIEVQYDLYDTTLVEGSGSGNDTEISNILTSQSFSYSCFFLQASEYFESTADQNAPRLSYNSFTRTPSESSMYRYNYFYNYGSENLPYISFDPNKVRLTVTKYYNNNTESETLQYNPETGTVTGPDFVYQTMVVNDENAADNGNVRVYFNDVGQYNFNFELIYTFENGGDYFIYTIPYEGMLDQKAYLFGAQLSYTDYATNQYQEFKLIENVTTETSTTYNQVSQGADVTHLWDDAASTGVDDFMEWLIDEKQGITPVSTDQTPLRFTTNLSQISETDVSTIEAWVLIKNEQNENEWTSYNSISDITSTINSPGTYFIKLTYNFASYTNNAGAIDASNAGEHFSQYFYFTIDKTAPSFTMQARGDYNEETEAYEWEQLLSKEYTNAEEVKLTYADFANPFHSAVTFEYERYDFINRSTSSGVITFNENGEYIFSQEGNYTIKIYYGKQGTAEDPSTSSFTIDRQNIQDLAAYSVYTSGANNDYRIGNMLEQYATNQNFVFSWQNVKASGARTYGKYKYYALDYADYYSSVDQANLSNLLGALLRNGILATDGVLNMSGTSNSWIDYSNASSLVSNNNIVPSSYVKSNAGLYIFQIYDQAGNSEIQIILLDNTQPYFVLYTADGYSLISANHTVTNDATLYWGDYKAIQVNGYNNDKFDDSVYMNKDGVYDEEIVTALQQFIDSIQTYSSSSSSAGSIGYGKDGSYYLCEINDTFAFKHKDTEDYVLTTGNSTDIQFSYTVHYTDVNGVITYYYSTTTGTNYINAQTGETVTATIAPGTGEYQINGQTLHEANIYLYSANGQMLYYYGIPGSLALTSTTGQTATATQAEDGSLYINGVALQSMTFVDMEGTYIFLIRDASNTEGAGETELQRYMQYASNYQYLRVTGDQSLTQIYYKETQNGTQTNMALTDAAYANIDVVNQDEGLMSRSSYYNPTSIETILYLSFMPTIEHDDNTTTQVAQVTLSYYPYQTAVQTYLTNDGQIRYVYYRTLAATPEFTQIVYDFETDGASTETIERQINVAEQMTSAGKYVVTRTYMTGETYTIDVFDYYQRNITSTVDRYGVLTSPETIGFTVTSRTYQIGGQTITATLHQNILQLVVNGEFPAYDLRYKATESGEFVTADGVPVTEYFDESTGTRIRLYEFDQIAGYAFYTDGAAIEPIPDGTSQSSDTSLESVVGGDIMINMYDGISPTSGVISVAFPYYQDDEMLPSGESFYTENITNWTNDLSPNTTLTTNKLPISLYIPQYKYTIYNQEIRDENNSSLSFSSISNDYLTRFNEDDEYSTISYYELVASISFTSSDGTTCTYTSTAGADGYLTFLDESGSPVSQFTQPGTYYVTITQGYNADSNSSNNFRKNYKFAFEIEDTSPEFTITQSGAPLSTLDDTAQVPNYYTNSKTITYSWEDLNNRYIADIDKNYIQITYANSQYSSTSNVIMINNGEISLQTENATLLGALSYSSSTDSRGVTTNYLTVDLEALGIYQNNSTVNLTMQFEGHDDAYYSRTTKRVTVDKQASFETVNSLINGLQGVASQALPLTDTTLRTYLDVEYRTVETAQEAAYNITVNTTTGELRNYSYLVDEAFFDNLSAMASENGNSANASSYNGGTIKAYYRQIDDPYNSTYEESYSDFTASAYQDMADGISITPGTYYQIVEEDLAGNLTFYIVYYFSVDDGNGYEDGIERDYQGITFTDNDTEKYASDSQIATGNLDLYSSTNFTLNNLNYQGDKWLVVTVNGQYYMFSPWLDDGYVYRLSNDTIETVSSSSMFNSFTSSTTPISLNISNRFTGSFAAVNLTLLDGVQLNTSMSSSQAAEYVNVSYSNAVFPVEIEISNNGNLVYQATNDPNALTNLSNPSYVYTASWPSENNIVASLQELYSRFNFAFNALPSNGSKIRYAITDNFGNTTILVHIFGQSTIEEITSEANRYEVQINDETTDGELVTYNISPVSLNYNFNDQLHYVRVTKWDGYGWVDAMARVDYNSSTNGTLVTYTFSNLAGGDLANLKFKLEVYEVAEEGSGLENGDPSLFVKDVYMQIYQMLPHLLDAEEDASNFVSSLRFTDNYGENVTNEILTDTTAYRVNIGGTVYNVTKSGQTFASRLTLTYSNSSSFDFPFTVQVYREDGSLGSNFVDTSSGSTFSQSGIYYFLVKYTDTLTNEYNLYRIEILDSSTEFYRVTNNGRTVEKASTYYQTEDGMEHSEYYIVNVNYNTSASLVEIVPNDYQNITVSQVGDPINEGNNVLTVAYRVTNYVEGVPPTGGVSPFDRLVFITYIPPTSSPVTEAFFTYNSAEQTDILSQSSIMSAISIENVDSGVLKLSYSRSYGLAGNLINISILKDGVPYYPEVKYETSTNNRQLSYVELDRSGTYSISFTDTAGNQQVFASGTSASSTTLTLIFLKDVSFSMTFTDANGVQQTTDPIQKGVFNNEVSLNLINPNSYYTAQSTGSGANMITATKNGEAYQDFTYNAETSSFTFSEPGYYSVYFSATASNGIELRHEIYNFTIVNPNESRYSFEFSPYDGYYIKSIVKDDLGDITKNANGSIPDALKQAFQTVIVDGQEYLKNVVTSFLDEATGEGYYTITIATNNYLNRDDYTTPTEFSFSYWINTSSVPINVSVTEGESTSDNIIVSFNAERVFEAVGECVIYIANSAFHVSADNIASLGTVSATISATGTYFITVRSMSGNLLYSYKVVKTEPLNAWAIAAIVIGAVVAIVVVIIIIKTRKRIKVK